jgi:hypothetical protein
MFLSLKREEQLSSSSSVTKFWINLGSYGSAYSQIEVKQVIIGKRWQSPRLIPLWTSMM